MSTAFSRFRQNAAAAPRAPTRSSNKYAGIPAGANRNPLPGVGRYRLRVVSTAERQMQTGDWYVGDFEVVQSSNPDHPAGSFVSFLQCVTAGKPLLAGGPRVKRFVMAAVGVSDEGEYDATDPDGELISASAGVASDKWGENPLQGRVLDANVTAGKPVKDTGDFYREWTFFPVPDEEQDE